MARWLASLGVGRSGERGRRHGREGHGLKQASVTLGPKSVCAASQQLGDCSQSDMAMRSPSLASTWPLSRLDGRLFGSPGDVSTVERSSPTSNKDGFETQSGIASWLESLGLLEAVADAIAPTEHPNEGLAALAQLSREELEMRLRACDLTGLGQMLWEGVCELRATLPPPKPRLPGAFLLRRGMPARTSPPTASFAGPDQRSQHGYASGEDGTAEYTAESAALTQRVSQLPRPHGLPAPGDTSPERSSSPCEDGFPYRARASHRKSCAPSREAPPSLRNPSRSARTARLNASDPEAPTGTPQRHFSLPAVLSSQPGDVVGRNLELALQSTLDLPGGTSSPSRSPPPAHVSWAPACSKPCSSVSSTCDASRQNRNVSAGLSEGADEAPAGQLLLSPTVVAPKRKVLRAGATQLRLNVAGLNPLAAMQESMKDMGFDPEDAWEDHEDESEEGEEPNTSKATSASLGGALAVHGISIAHALPTPAPATLFHDDAMDAEGTKEKPPSRRKSVGGKMKSSSNLEGSLAAHTLPRPAPATLFQDDAMASAEGTKEKPPSRRKSMVIKV